MNNPYIDKQAESDFNKARNRATLTEIQYFLTPDKEQLLSFNDVKKLLKPQNEVYMGMQVIPIDMIVGSEGRYHDFTNRFLPKGEYLRQRWESVDKAHLTDIILPAITLYELGGLYFVRDGNHRVSVAKAQGATAIDAEVISLHSEIRLKPGLSRNEIEKEVINYEKRVFYSETNFGDITDCWDMNFTSPGGYDVIYNHILVHKYFINEKQTTEIPFQDAVLSWYRNVYTPVIAIINKNNMLKSFKKRTTSDMYVWIIKHWDDLKHKYGIAYSLDEAAKDFTAKYGVTKKEYIKLFFKNFFHIKTKN